MTAPLLNAARVTCRHGYSLRVAPTPNKRLVRVGIVTARGSETSTVFSVEQIDEMIALLSAVRDECKAAP